MSIRLVYKDNEVKDFILIENNFLKMNFKSMSKFIIVFKRPIDNFCKQDSLLKLALQNKEHKFLKDSKSKYPIFNICKFVLIRLFIFDI